MKRKILVVILAVALLVSVLSGCTFVVKNNVLDSMQVIARVKAISDSGADKHVLNTDGYYEYTLPDNFFKIPANQNNFDHYTTSTVFYERGGYIYSKQDGNYSPVYDVTLQDLVEKTENWSFTHEEREIYKYELFSLINQYGNEYVNNYGYTWQRVTEMFVDQLVERAVMLTEAERFIAKGAIKLDNAYKNAVSKGIYQQIDAQINSYLNEIRTERGYETIDATAEPDNTTTKTTYPLYPHNPESEQVGEEPLWDVTSPSVAAKWPGMSGSSETRSMETQALVRFLRGLQDILSDDFRMSKAEKKQTADDFAEIERIINTQGAERVYPVLGDLFIIDYLIGKTVVEEQKLALLKDYIDGDVEVSEADILLEYNETIRKQSEQYETLSNYDTAKDEKLVLVNPRPDKYIYVKHILVKFNEEDQKVLDAYDKTPGATEEGRLALREQFAANIIAYEHVDGEDDTSRPFTFRQIENIIRSRMAAVAGDPTASAREFDRLIYRFNQDDGAFESYLGYAVINELEGEETDTYVPEFSEGARALRNEKNLNDTNKYSVGDLLDYNVITQYGVHFMFYNFERPTETPRINDYVTVAQYDTYRDLLVETVEANKSTAIYDEWKAATLHDYKTLREQVKIYTSRYKDIYK